MAAIAGRDLADCGGSALELPTLSLETVSEHLVRSSST